MEKEKINEDKAPKANEDETLDYFFESLIFLTTITPEDDSINNNNLLDELIALDPETKQIFKEFLFEHRNNQLVKMVFNNIDKNKELIREEAKKTKKTIYRTVIHPEDPAPSPLEDPFVSLRNDMNDLRRLINELFPHNNATEDPKKFFHSQMVVSAIINDLRIFDTNPLLLLSEEASYYLNSNNLKKIIKSLSEEERYASELQMLKESDQLHDKILSIIISKDKTYLGSLIDQSSEDVAITIHKMLKMAIEYGAYFMAEFALEQWSLYFENHQLTKESYRQLVSLVGHALIRSNTEICLLLTKPEMWKLYIEEDQLRLLELVMYRTGESTKKILISNMKANGFLNLELCQRIPAKTEYQRKIIKAILDEYNEYYQEMLDNIKEILAENQKDKIELLISSFNSLPKEWQQKLTKKYGKIKFMVKDIKSPGASKLLQSLEEQETAPKTKAKETKSSDQSLADEELIKLFGEKPKDKEPKNPKKKHKKKPKETESSIEVPQKIATEEPEPPKTQDVISLDNSVIPIQQIEKPSEESTVPIIKRSIQELGNGVIILTEECSVTGKVYKERFYLVKRPIIESTAKETTPPTAMEIRDKSIIVREVNGVKYLIQRNSYTGELTCIYYTEENGIISFVSPPPATRKSEAPKTQNVTTTTEKDTAIPLGNSDNPIQKTEELSAKIKRYIEKRPDGVIVIIYQCLNTKKIVSKEYLYPVLQESNNGSTAEETTTTASTETTTTASTESNKAGETKAGLAKLAADNNSQSSYSLTAKIVVEFNLSLSSNLIYEEVENTEQDEYKEAIEQVEQRLEDQSANIQFENIANEQKDSLFGNLHNNSFIPLLPSDKQEFSLPFLIIGDPLEAGKVLDMIEHHNDLANIMI